MRFGDVLYGSVALLLLAAPPLSAQCQQTKLIASDAALHDRFGVSVDTDGAQTVVGADHDGPLSEGPGAAYIFVRDGALWGEEASLSASAPHDGDSFGTSVSIDADLVAVGAPGYVGGGEGSELGAGFLFRRAEGESSWFFESEFGQGLAVDGDRFGAAVSLSGERLAIGAPRRDAPALNQGAVFVFRHEEGSWVLEDELVADDGAALDEFGSAVALEGELLLVGAPSANVGEVSNAGAVYVFRLAAGSAEGVADAWVQDGKLTASDGAANAQFGSSVALEDIDALVGAPTASGSGPLSGKAYSFRRIAPGQWIEDPALIPDDGSSFDQFGSSVALKDHVGVVGARLAGPTLGNLGAAYVFQKEGGVWTQSARLEAEDGSAGDEFGIAVTWESDLLVIGMHQPDLVGAGSGPGAVYAFARPLGFPAFGAGFPGFGGQSPALALEGCPVADSFLTLKLSDARPAASTLVLVGQVPASIPFGTGLTLLVDPILGMLSGGATAADGTLTLQGHLPSGTLAGLTATLQVFVLDPDAAGGVAASHGVEMATL